ncbi:hypothetical protein A3758_13895 [Oleiphilus sp. HI0118]|nr:hypothetical protein A3758_13895 [Oleiphilus sp. HI0118]
MSDVSVESFEGLSAEEFRALRIILDAIDRLQLSLDGLTVLTEVGTNNYLYTPIIAALAGAEKVYAWTADTAYGLGSDTIEKCSTLAAKLKVLSRIEFSNNEKKRSHIESANIITNSGFIRPIDSDFLEHVNVKQCVIPLMYEAWECRESDVDIHACKEAGIKVAGTWENHPAIKVFDATGPLAVKLAMEAGFEVYRNNIAVWSTDEFGVVAAKTYKKLGAASVLLTSNKMELVQALPSLDFIYFCDYAGKTPLVDLDGILTAQDIQCINPGIGIVHLFGAIDAAELIGQGLDIYPHKSGYIERMTETLAYLGPEPSLSLTVAGFKVGQSMTECCESELLQWL